VYIEKVPNLADVACFAPGRAKDLSVPPCMSHIVDGTDGGML